LEAVIVGDTNLHVNLDDAPAFNADPTDLNNGPVFDADLDVLDDGPVFDTEPVLNRVTSTEIQFAQSGSERRGAESEQRAALYTSNEVPIFDAEFAIFDQEPGDFTTMCSSAVFNAKFIVYDEQLIFDAEYVAHEEPVFHDRPLFDEESTVHDMEPVFNVPQQQPDVHTTACVDFIFANEPIFDDEPFHNLTTTSSIDNFVTPRVTANLITLIKGLIMHQMP
jgi:hypothetical protein